MNQRLHASVHDSSPAPCSCIECMLTRTCERLTASSARLRRELEATKELVVAVKAFRKECGAYGWLGTKASSKMFDALAALEKDAEEKSKLS